MEKNTVKINSKNGERVQIDTWKKGVHPLDSHVNVHLSIQLWRCSVIACLKSSTVAIAQENQMIFPLV